MTDRIRGHLQALRGDVRHVDAPGTPVARHDGLPAADRPCADDHDPVTESHVELLDPVQRTGERIGDGREIRGKLRRKPDEVLRRDGWDRRELRVRARIRVVAVQEVVLAQVLEPFDAPTTGAAREDRPEEHPITEGDTRWQHRVGPDALEHADGFVPELPRWRSLRVAVEEGASIRATDAARLHPKDGSGGIELRWRDILSDLDGVDPGHEGRAHHPASSLIACRAFAAVQRSRMTRESALVIASGRGCMKMFRPTEHPMAPASIACSIRWSNSASSSREPPARTTGTPLAASTHLANDSWATRIIPLLIMITFAPPATASRVRAPMSASGSRNVGDVMPWSRAQITETPSGSMTRLSRIPLPTFAVTMPSSRVRDGPR